MGIVSSADALALWRSHKVDSDEELDLPHSPDSLVSFATANLPAVSVTQQRRIRQYAERIIQVDDGTLTAPSMGPSMREVRKIATLTLRHMNEPVTEVSL